MSIGSKTKTTVNPGAADPYVQAGMKGAQDLYNKGPVQYYSGDTVADFNPVQQMALQGTVMRSAQGTPDTTGLAQNALRSTLSGEYLNPQNPYMNMVSKGVLDSVLPRVQSMFTSAGRTGSNANMETLTQAATQALAPVYQQERQNQLNAMFQAPSFDQGATQNDLSRYQAMLNAGNAYQGQSQQEIDAQKQRFDFQQMAPWQQQQLYQGILNPYASMYSNQTQKQSQSAIPMILGGAAMAAQMAAGMPPTAALSASMTPQLAQAPYKLQIPSFGG